jgi:hypothetical protein
MSIPDGFELLVPWQPIGQHAEELTAELRRELSQKHVLYGRDLKAVATRRDRDDVLFEIDNKDEPLVVVHLTRRQETDPRWPTTKFFKNWEHWLKEEMLPAHKEYDL